MPEARRGVQAGFFRPVRSVPDAAPVRSTRLALGNPGDVRPVGKGVRELRIDVGPGYRVYFVQRGSMLIVLLCGGDKRTQKRDIRVAKDMAGNLENEQCAS
jgi:putative addiction module killer protein